MSFTPKNLTQGGQMTAYRLRMFAQVNQWIFHWILLAFFIATAFLFWAVTPVDALVNGFWYWAARLSSGFLPLMNPNSPATWDVVWHCGNGLQICTTKMTLGQVLADPWMQMQGGQLVANLKLCAAGCGIVGMLLFCTIVWYVGRIGSKESEDEFISGMKLTDDVASVNRMLKKAGQKSDLQIGGLHMVKNAEVLNFLIHGTIGVGKSTLIRWLLDFIRKRGDRAIIYDSGCTFTETHYDERIDKILNAHDKRCENWVLWREGKEVVDYENLTASLIPVEGESDPFWVSSSRTIFSDTAMRFASDKDRSIEKFLTALLSIDLKSLREFLKNTPSANLVEEKIEKTAISIRSVVTNYAKALRYLQGLDKEGKPEFSIREWMTDPQYDKSWLFISTTARHRKSVRPLISMWLSLATIYLQSMGEDPDRRVWFIIDEKTGLQKIPEFSETLAEGRKYGGCFVIGIQNMPQLINVYGREVAKSIFDLLNTRAYGRSPSADVAKIVEEELGHQRRREAREQNSFGLDQIRDGISISRDKVKEPVVDYDNIMSMPNLRFYFRLPGEYPVVKLDLKYRKQKKYHKALIERDFHDALSPALEQIIQSNERDMRGAGIAFPTGDEILEKTSGEEASEPQQASAPHAEKKAAIVKPEPEKPRENAVAPTLKPTPTPTPTPTPVSNVKPESPPDTKPAPVTPVVTSAAPPKAPYPPLDDAWSATVPTVSAAASNVHAFPERQAAKPASVSAESKGLSPLDRLRRIQDKKSGNEDEGNGEESQVASEAQGEAHSLDMNIDVDEWGEITFKTEGVHKGTPESLDDALANDHGAANRSMADDEQNILRHHHDYDAYEQMHDHHDPGGFER